MTLLSRGLAFLRSKLAEGAGVSVVYSRGATSGTITAWVGTTLFTGQVRDGIGGFVEWGERDYLFPLSAISTSFTEPRRGDRITETINGVSMTFEIQGPQGEVAWRYSDSERKLVRVHCKRVP
jgi:hypothetical protein